MRNYSKQMDHRMFDFAHFYERMANQLPNGSVIAEIGTADGASALYLAEALLNLEKRFRLVLVDNLAYGGPDQLSHILHHLLAAQIPAECLDFLAMDSLTACGRFPDYHFDLVFIDSSHRIEPTKAEIREWYYKVKENGILAGHDYNEGEGKEVKMAVDLVIPRDVTRTDIPGRVFEPEPVLHIEATERGLNNIWWMEKHFYVKLQ